jgi:hypothetical protein
VTEKLIKHKRPSIGQSLAELIKAEGSECVWNTEQWMESSIVPAYEMGGKTINYGGISLLSSPYKIFIQYSFLGVNSVVGQN